MEKRVTSAFGCKLFERISVQGTHFLVTLLLARLLTPSDYGTVSVVTIFIALATTFVQGGFNTALIQKKDVDGTGDTAVGEPNRDLLCHILYCSVDS